MSLGTNIEWTDASWPVIRGCTKVSPGCDNCWAIRDAHLHAGNKSPKMQEHFKGLTHIVNGRPNWTGVVRLDESILDWPLRWKQPRRVFVASSGDLFHESLKWSAIDDVFDVMRRAHWHTYQVLTKRAEEMHSFMENWAFHHDGPLPNVWLGVSVENQETADARIPWLLKAPAAVRWVSYEPALGPVDFERWLNPPRYPDARPEMREQYADAWRKQHPTLDWLVVGGESGPGARPFDLAWARSTIAQCRAAGVLCFVKQLGAFPIALPGPDGPWPPDTRWRGGTFQGKEVPLLKDRKGGDMQEWPNWACVREYPG